ncbi:MAG TPA: Rieske (2Fe-2S) protein [Solirubrobacterales bacterium]|nr:Rieske (2Fe-2S) protein [Solirubrobacterales bacterium]
MEFDKAVAELQALVDTLEREGDERALLLLQLIDAIHRPALERIAAGDFDDPIALAVLDMYEIPAPEDDAHVLARIENLRRPVFVEAGAAADLAPGEVSATEVDGISLILVRLDDEIYALHDGCPVDGGSLAGGRLSTDGVLVCPWHNCAFDVRTGARVDGEAGERLGVAPVATRNGTIQVAVNVT